MSKSAKILCIVFGIIIAAGLLYAVLTFIPDYRTESRTFRPLDLRVNYRDDPVGTDLRELTFSWRSESETNGMFQSAYRIVVSERPDMKKSYWDSGKVSSDLSACVAYGGRMLQPETKYYWQVTVWDQNDEYRASEEIGSFETCADSAKLEKAQFIAEYEESEDVKEYTIEFDASIRSEALGLMLDARNDSDYLLWQFNIVEHGRLYLRKHVFSGGGYTLEEVDISNKCGGEIGYGDTFHVAVKSDMDDVVTYVNGNVIDTTPRTQDAPGGFGFRQAGYEKAVVDGLVTTVRFADGSQKTIAYNYEQVEKPFSFDSEGSSLVLSTNGGEHHSYVSLVSGRSADKSGAVMFRKSFETRYAPEDIVCARVYTTALGNFNLFINGVRVGTDELKPGWTDYRNRAQYFSYDVTELVRQKDNTLCAWVTSGWWNGAVSFGTYGNLDNAFLMRLVIEYKNGRTQEILTDNTWEWNRSLSPVREASIYDGETYDAALTDVALHAGGSDADWHRVRIFKGFDGVLSPADGPEIAVREEYTRMPGSVTIYNGTEDNGSDYGRINIISQPEPCGTFTLNAGETAVIDLGQNMVGWPQFTVDGAKGTLLTLRFGEMLNDSGKASRGNDGPEGSVYTANYRSARSTNKYYLAGGGPETYHTEYSFYGFRYVSITASDTVTFTDFRGMVVGSVNDVTGGIVTSDDSVNQLISNIMWGMMGNYLSVPTDCPQRNERLGWTGDTQVFVGTGSYNADVASFFRKWLLDCIDSQTSDGAYPDVIPASNATGAGAAAWGDAGIIVPYTMYKKYGDIWVMRRNYESMEQYMRFVEAHGGPLERYGDWLAYENTEQSLIRMAYYAYDALLMRDISAALGKNDRAQYYDELYKSVKKNYIDAFVSESYGLWNDSQTGAILTLLLNLTPDEETYRYVLEQLTYSIDRNGGRLQTGFVGTAYIVRVLSALGADETAYTLLLQRGNPSWLYSVDQGATTMWERWDSYTLANGFGDVGMNSFNHYAYGCVGEWMYAYMAGINGYDGDAGFKSFRLEPRLDPQRRITSVDAYYDSVYGRIESAWEVTDTTAKYHFRVPANTSADISLELSGSAGALTLTVRVADNSVNYKICELMAGDTLADGLKFTEIADGRMIMHAVSGNYDIILS